MIVLLLATVAVLISGLLALTLRRRNNLLQEYLTPEEPDIEQEFFHLPRPKEEEAEPEPDHDQDPAVEETLWPELPPEMKG